MIPRREPTSANSCHSCVSRHMYLDLTKPAPTKKLILSINVPHLTNPTQERERSKKLAQKERKRLRNL